MRYASIRRSIAALPRWLCARSLTLVAAAAIAEEVADPLAEEVTRMARVGGAFGGTFSNDGARIAFLTNLSGVLQAWVMSAEGGYPRQVTAFDDPVGNVA